MHGFDDGGVFEGCMPVEVMARRGEDTLRYGPLKPVGLARPAHRDVKTMPSSSSGATMPTDTIYNIVGFQTHLTCAGAEARVLHDPGAARMRNSSATA